MSNYQNYVSNLADKKCDEFPIIILLFTQPEIRYIMFPVPVFKQTFKQHSECCSH